MAAVGNNRKLILLVIFLLCVHIQALSKWGDKEFGKCPPGETRFQVFLKTSITDCVKECAKRPVCKVIGYKRSHNMCELHTAAADPGTGTAINDKKCIQIKMESVDTSQIIGGCSCADWQVCDVTTTTCSYKECDPETIGQSVTDVRGVIYGNMNNIGARKRLQCNPGFHSEINKNMTVCGATGQWSSKLECKGIIQNVAIGKPAVQSSTVYAGQATAAVDGDTVQYWNTGTCFHTDHEENPWWRVDLERSYNVSYFILYNRMDTCCNNRASDVKVKFGQTLETLEVVDLISGTLPAIYRKDFEHGELTRYVHITMPGLTGAFNLCEVEVYGYPG